MVTRAPPPTPHAAQRQLRGPPGPALRTAGSASLPSCPVTVAWDGPNSDDIATACRGPTVCRTWSRARKGGEEPEGPALHSPRQPCGAAQAARHPCLGSPSAGREVWSRVCPLSVLLLVILQTGKPSLRKAPRPATRRGPRRSACVRRHAVGTRQASGHCRAEENVWGRAASCSPCHGPVRVLLKRGEPVGGTSGPLGRVPSLLSHSRQAQRDATSRDRETLVPCNIQPPPSPAMAGCPGPGAGGL